MKKLFNILPEVFFVVLTLPLFFGTYFLIDSLHSQPVSIYSDGQAIIGEGLAFLINLITISVGIFLLVVLLVIWLIRKKLSVLRKVLFSLIFIVTVLNIFLWKFGEG